MAREEHPPSTRTTSSLAATISPVLLNHRPSPTDEYPKSLILSRGEGTGKLVIQYYPIVQVFHKEDILFSVLSLPVAVLIGSGRVQTNRSRVYKSIRSPLNYQKHSLLKHQMEGLWLIKLYLSPSCCLESRRKRSVYVLIPTPQVALIFGLPQVNLQIPRVTGLQRGWRFREDSNSTSEVVTHNN